jgi:hypothetical protein
MIEADCFIFPILTTDIRYEDYIEDSVDPEKWNLQRLPWVFTKRIDGKLKLVENIN